MATPLTTFDATSDQLYSYMLLNRMRSPWVYSPSLAFLKDNDAWNVLLADTDIAGIRQKRNQNIVRPWRVSPDPHATRAAVPKSVQDKSKRKAAICNEGLSQIDDFDMSRFINADSFFLGRRYATIEFEEVTCSLDGSPPMNWFLPVRIQDVDRRRFRWVPVWTDAAKSKLARVDLSMFDLNTGEWVVLDMDRRRKLIEDVWEPTEDRIGHGRGAIEALFFSHFFKTGTLQKVMQFVDSVANGRFIVELDSTRNASTDLPNDVIQSTTLANFNKMRSQHVIVRQNGDKVEYIEPTGSGAAVSMELVHYFLESAERMANGAVRQSGHSPGGKGGQAAAEEEGDTGEAYYQLGRDHSDNVYNRDLLGAFLYWNEHNFEALGLNTPDVKRPKFSSQQVKKQDPKERMEVLNSSKVPVPLRHYYDAMECPVPEPDEEVVESSPDPAMADMEVDPETGHPKTSQEARQHDEKMAKAKKPKPAKFAAPSGEMTRGTTLPAERSGTPDGSKRATDWGVRFKHLNGPHDTCNVCKRIERMGVMSQAQAVEMGFPHPAHPNCDHVWVVEA